MKNYICFFVSIGLPSAQISYIPAAVGLQTPTLTPAGEQRYFEYPLTPQPMSAAAAGQMHRDSILQRSKILRLKREKEQLILINKLFFRWEWT